VQKKKCDEHLDHHRLTPLMEHGVGNFHVFETPVLRVPWHSL
jgi:hypothetical protein